MILKKISFALLAVFALVQVQAQSLKIGYVDTDSVIVSMPQFKTQQTTLQTYSKQLQNKLKTTLEQSQKKMGELQQKVQGGEMSEKDAQAEAYRMQLQLNSEEKQAQASLSKKEEMLLQPLYDKIDKTIKAVAKENGYTYILSEQMFLYGAKANDLTGLIIQKVNAQ